MSQSYQVGDHANGHVWSGTDWVQLPNSSWVYNHQTQNYERAQVTPQSSPALPNMWSPGSNSTTATAYSQHAGGHHPGAVGGQHPNMQGFTFGAPARPPVASVEYYAGVWHSHVMTNPVLNLQTWLDTAVPAEAKAMAMAVSLPAEAPTGHREDVDEVEVEDRSHRHGIFARSLNETTGAVPSRRLYS